MALDPVCQGGGRLFVAGFCSPQAGRGVPLEQCGVCVHVGALPWLCAAFLGCFVTSVSSVFLSHALPLTYRCALIVLFSFCLCAPRGAHGV